MKEKKFWSGERWEPRIQNETAIEHLHRYALACELSAGKTILDIACGEGFGSWLLAANAISVTGVDIDETTIHRAKEKYKTTNIQFLTADARTTALPDRSFDLVVSFETLEHITEHDQLISEFKRLLKPGGQLIISTPDKEQYTIKSGYQNPFHKKELTRPEFETLLHKYFKQVSILVQDTCHSSFINNPDTQKLDRYTGDHLQIQKNGWTNGLYLLAIASDDSLPEINSSIFNGHSVLQAALKTQEDLLKQTLSYRVGHFLLSPFKWIKKLFQ